MAWRVLVLILAMAAPASGASWIAPLGPGSSDAELEQVVRVAYKAAIDYSASNRNYFARDGITAPLREAIASSLSSTGLGVDVAPEASATIAKARACLGRAGTELRFVVNVFGDGLALAAVTATRSFAYEFDPREMNDVLVYPAEPCRPG